MTSGYFLARSIAVAICCRLIGALLASHRPISIFRPWRWAIAGICVEAVGVRIGADAIGVTRQQSEIFVDLLGADHGARNQRILAVAERRIGNAVEFAAEASGDGGNCTGVPSHHHATAIASAVSAKCASAEAIGVSVRRAQPRSRISLAGNRAKLCACRRVRVARWTNERS